MNLEKAIEILEHHNRWRRDENVPNSLDMVNPTELGKAIDLVTVELRMRIVAVTFKEKNINRFEVIDNKGRSYTNWIDKPFKIETSLQDEGKTLKVFLNE